MQRNTRVHHAFFGMEQSLEQRNMRSKKDEHELEEYIISQTRRIWD